MTWKDRQLWAVASRVLTTTQYETLWLHVACEASIDDIARSYGVSRQAIHARLAGARRRLADTPEFTKRKAAA